MLIGRDDERKILQDALTDEYSQFIAVYGRRRVGKTFLIRESYDYHFTFQFTGAAKIPARKQLARFRMALKEHGLTDMLPVFSNWIIAFSELKRFITLQPEGKKKSSSLTNYPGWMPLALVFFLNWNRSGTDGHRPERTSYS